MCPFYLRKEQKLMEQNRNDTQKRKDKKNKVRIVVKPIYVGENSMKEVFEKVAYDNIRNKFKSD